jgi:hypothetical protein
MKTLWLCILMFFWATTVKAESFTQYINKAPQHEPTKQELRIVWKDFLGVDAFEHYFAVKEIEREIKKKSEVKVGGFKGILDFGDDYKSVTYAFRVRF